MDHDELEKMRLKLRVLARQIALERIVAALRTEPGGQQALSLWAVKMRDQAEWITIPQLDAASSDLTSAEWREAIAEMLAELGL